MLKDRVVVIWLKFNRFLWEHWSNLIFLPHLTITKWMSKTFVLQKRITSLPFHTTIYYYSVSKGIVARNTKGHIWTTKLISNKWSHQKCRIIIYIWYRHAEYFAYLIIWNRGRISNSFVFLTGLNFPFVCRYCITLRPHI